MKLKSVYSNVLTNKLVLNVVSLLSIITIIGYLMTQNLNAIVYFIALGILVFFFSKNMIVVLGVPLILVNLYVMMNNVKEGLENNTTSTKQENNDEKSAITTTKHKLHEKKKDSTREDKKTPQGLPRTKIDSNTTLNSSIDTGDHEHSTTDESFEVGRAKRCGGYNIDYASTVEDAYDDLSKIIGGDGIKNLTNDTQKLMNQQLQLAEAMKGMEPLIKNMAPLMKQAEGLLGGMGNKEGLGGIMDMAKKMARQSTHDPTNQSPPRVKP